MNFTIPTSLCSLHLYNKELFCIMPAIAFLCAKYLTVSHRGNNAWLGKDDCHKGSYIFKLRLYGKSWQSLDSNFLPLV